MLIIEAVAALPFTVEVKELVVVLIVLVVEEATTPDISRLVVTPLTLDVICEPFEDNVFPEITLVVAITPFTLVVKVLPVTL